MKIQLKIPEDSSWNSSGVFPNSREKHFKESMQKDGKFQEGHDIIESFKSKRNYCNVVHSKIKFMTQKSNEKRNLYQYQIASVQCINIFSFL